jgi:hypothetical protein
MAIHCNHETHVSDSASCDALFALKAAAMFYGEKSPQYNRAQTAYMEALTADSTTPAPSIDELFAELDELTAS